MTSRASKKQFCRWLAAGLFFVLPLQALAVVSNDTLYADQWYLERIAAPTAWNTAKGSPDMVVAVLDTGIDLNHPDLAERLWKNTAEIPNNGKDDDNNGYVDDFDGWDFVSNDRDPSVSLHLATNQDAVSHGTLVAGLIAAETNNNYGFAGVTWEGKVMPLRMLDEAGVGTEQDAAEAIDYAVANGAKVINMSFAGDHAGLLLSQAAERAYEAGVVIVSALGNNATNVNLQPVYPACISLHGVDFIIGVTSVDDQDRGSDFSNYGSDCADLAAPGEGIMGLGYLDSTQGYTDFFSGPWNGTSTSSPLVAGAVAILLGAYPDLTPEQVVTVLKLSVDPITSVVGQAGSFGVGRLNIARALEVGASFSSFVPGTAHEDKEPLPAEAEASEFSPEHYSFVALGAPAGERPDVRVYRADGIPYATFTAYTLNFSGGVRTILEDFDDDGIPEVVTAAGESGGPHIRIFKAFGSVVNEFFAYSKESTHGVNISVGDIDADGQAEIVTAVGQGVSNDVVVWSQAGEEKLRFAVSGFAPDAPLMVAVADIDSDWQGEILVWSPEKDSHVAIYNHDGSLFNSLSLDSVPHDGIALSTGDFDGDSQDEIVASVPTADGASIRLYNKIGAFVGGFSLTQPNLIGGAEVHVADIDFNDVPDIVVAPHAAAGEVQVMTPTGALQSTVGATLVGARGTNLAAW